MIFSSLPSRACGVLDPSQEIWFNWCTFTVFINEVASIVPSNHSVPGVAPISTADSATRHLLKLVVNPAVISIDSTSQSKLVTTELSQQHHHQTVASHHLLRFRANACLQQNTNNTMQFSRTIVGLASISQSALPVEDWRRQQIAVVATGHGCDHRYEGWGLQ